MVQLKGKIIVLSSFFWSNCLFSNQYCSSEISSFKKHNQKGNLGKKSLLRMTTVILHSKNKLAIEKCLNLYKTCGFICNTADCSYHARFRQITFFLTFITVPSQNNEIDWKMCTWKSHWILDGILCITAQTSMVCRKALLV